MNVAVLGGGAAGFFSALSCKVHHPDADVTLFEKSSKLLSKVKVSGGGRCNVTHDCLNTNTLSKSYPRGERFLKKAFNQFSVSDTVKWFESRGVKLKIEDDGRMFPTTNDSDTIIRCLMDETKLLNVNIKTQSMVSKIEEGADQINLTVDDEQLIFDRVIVATGGSPKLEGLKWLEVLGHKIELPVPSLFTFNMPSESIKSLMGLVVKNASVKVQGTKLKQSGPLLITHWGMSGPAILKTSAWGARYLNDVNYDFSIQVNWLNDATESDIRSAITEVASDNPKKKILNKNPFDIPSRLWDFLLEKIHIRKDMIWSEIGSKGMNKLVNILLNDVYRVSGKTTFKEEFVTCGGVSLSDIDSQSMQSKVVENLYFAGEVLDIDGVTGGFNFQSAWTTGFIAGKLKG